MDCNKIYPRTGDTQTVYLKSVVNRPTIEVGDCTIYNDFAMIRWISRKITCCIIIRLIMTV